MSHRPDQTAPATSVRDALFDDPALIEALATCAANSRLSDQDVRAQRDRRRRTLMSGVAATLLLAIGAVTLWAPPNDGTQQIAHYETRRGQQLAVRLADGSTLHLNGATRLAVTLASDRREVRLDRGEAYFDVAHDPARPFTVHAGNSGAQVLGTAFDVDLRRGRVELAVYRGAVRFGRDGPGGDGVVVKAGWHARFDGNEADAPQRFDAAQQDWRQGWLDTQDMTLADLVDVLNRHGGPLVLPPPPALANLPISGRFRLDDSQQLLAAIGAAYGFNVHEEGDTLRLNVTS